MPAPTEGQRVRRQTQDALCESQERSGGLFENAGAGVALADRNGRFLRVNRQYCRLLGYTEKELCQLDYASLLHPDDGEANLNKLARLESGQTPVVRFPGRYLHKNGQFVHLQKCVSMVSDRDEGAAYLITVAERRPEAIETGSPHDRELLARLYETIPVLLVLWDPRLQMFTLNAHTERVLGWTPADANDGDFMSKVYPDPEYRAKVCAYMQALAPGWREWIGTARNGERIPIEWANIRLSDNTMIGIGVDMRQRKAAESALRASEARFQSIVETNVIGVLFADVQSGLVLDANDEYLRIIGRTRQELREGKINWKSITPAEDLKREEMLVCCCQSGERVVPFDKNYIRPDGTQVPVFIGGSVLPHDHGKAVGFVLDIGERKEAEQALRESEHRYRTLFNSIDEGFCIIEIEFDENLRATDYRFLETNPSFRRQTGICDIVGKSMRSLAPELEDHWFEIYGSVALTGKPVRFQQFAKRLNRWYDVYAFQFGDAEKRQVAVLFSDITGQRHAAEQLRQMNELLEQRVAERTEEVRQQAAQLRALASQLSQAEQRERKRLAKILHDHIQQLIVAARMQMAWMKCDGDSERQAIVQGVDAILDEALDASRSLAMDLSPPVLHEAGLIGGLNWLATRMWVKHQFTVNLQADNKAEPATEEVRFLLFECARELLFNAIKHAGVTEADVVLRRTDDRSLELTVCDRGAGFDAEQLNRRGADEITFGLFSIRERLAHIGGQMAVKTGPGQGTLIRLSVPAAQALPAELSDCARQYHAPAHQTELRVCRVLIADDHKIMREGLVRLLQYESDIEVVGQASDGQQAVDMAGELEPDIIIMDINLGEMSGIEAARRIRLQWPDIRVIGLSMHEDRNVAKAMREAGASAYLTKMGPADELIAAIRACFCG